MDLPSSQAHVMEQLLDRLRDQVGSHEKPHLLTLQIDEKMSKEALKILDNGEVLVLGDILRDPRNRNNRLATVPLMLNSGDQWVPLPWDDYRLKKDDQILFCGRKFAHHLMDSTLNNEYSLHYVLTGVDKPRSYLMQWLTKHLKPAQM